MLFPAAAAAEDRAALLLEAGVVLVPPFLPSPLVDPVVEGACRPDLHLGVLEAGAVDQGDPDGTDQEALEACKSNKGIDNQMQDG